ncbi:MAG: metal-dependent transcriptional regulator [Sphaerochaetaceae bacterium]
MSILSDYTTENYLKAIVKYLATPGKTKISTGELAALLKVTSGTTTTMIKKLEREGYVSYISHQGCSLTAKGMRYGLRILRRHRLLETFLVNVLDLTWDEAHEEAEKLEHSTSDYLVDKIDQYLNYPTKGPSGNMIPRKEQTDYMLKDTPLIEAPLNTEIVISRVSSNSKMASYFQAEGLLPGARITLLDINREVGIATAKMESGIKNLSLVALNHLYYEKG